MDYKYEEIKSYIRGSKDIKYLLDVFKYYVNDPENNISPDDKISVIIYFINKSVKLDTHEIVISLINFIIFDNSIDIISSLNYLINLYGIQLILQVIVLLIQQHQYKMNKFIHILFISNLLHTKINELYIKINNKTWKIKNAACIDILRYTPCESLMEYKYISYLRYAWIKLTCWKYYTENNSLLFFK